MRESASGQNVSAGSGDDPEDSITPIVAFERRVVRQLDSKQLDAETHPQR